MHISHDFIATKTCPSAVFRNFRKDAGLRPKTCGARAGWDGLRAGADLNFAGQERTKLFNPRMTLVPTPLHPCWQV